MSYSPEDHDNGSTAQFEIERLRAENGRLKAEIVRLVEALKPFAEIPLWRDRYPDARLDCHCPGDMPISVEHIRAARAAMRIA